jgi:hypothetical protein
MPCKCILSEEINIRMAYLTISNKKAACHYGQTAKGSGLVKIIAAIALHWPHRSGNKFTYCSQTLYCKDIYLMFQ